MCTMEPKLLLPSSCISCFSKHWELSWLTGAVTSAIEGDRWLWSCQWYLCCQHAAVLGNAFITIHTFAYVGSRVPVLQSALSIGAQSQQVFSCNSWCHFLVHNFELGVVFVLLHWQMMVFLQFLGLPQLWILDRALLCRGDTTSLYADRCGYLERHPN